MASEGPAVSAHSSRDTNASPIRTEFAPLSFKQLVADATAATGTRKSVCRNKRMPAYAGRTSDMTGLTASVLLRCDGLKVPGVDALRVDTQVVDLQRLARERVEADGAHKQLVGKSVGALIAATTNRQPSITKSMFWPGPRPTCIRRSPLGNVRPKTLFNSLPRQDLNCALASHSGVMQFAQTFGQIWPVAQHHRTTPIQFGKQVGRSVVFPTGPMCPAPSTCDCLSGACGNRAKSHRGQLRGA
jgi:hypothetical protein